MTPNLETWVKNNRPSFAGNVLEIGSLNVNGSVRKYFPDATKYVGIDVVMGANVDIVMNAHDISMIFSNNEIDTVICLETIEHDDKFWVTIENIKNVLKTNGTLLLSSPTIDFPIHHQPDYWRFTTEGIINLVNLAGCDVEIIESLPDTIGKHSIIAKGKKL